MLALALRILEGLRQPSAWSTLAGWAKAAVRYLAEHTGLPALLVAAVLAAVGFRLLKKTLRFAVEVAILGAALAVLTELGWIRW